MLSFPVGPTPLDSPDSLDSGFGEILGQDMPTTCLFEQCGPPGARHSLPADCGEHLGVGTPRAR